MRHRLLSGLAIAPLTLGVVAAGPAEAAARQPVAAGRAAEVGEPAKPAADSVALLAGGMVMAASAAFAGTGMVRRRKVPR